MLSLETMTKLECQFHSKLECKTVDPPPLESPVQRFLVPKVPPSENGRTANFISILYRIATSELYPLKALEFIS